MFFLALPYWPFRMGSMEVDFELYTWLFCLKPQIGFPPLNRLDFFGGNRFLHVSPDGDRPCIFGQPNLWPAESSRFPTHSPKTSWKNWWCCKKNRQVQFCGIGVFHNEKLPKTSVERGTPKALSRYPSAKPRWLIQGCWGYQTSVSRRVPKLHPPGNPKEKLPAFWAPKSHPFFFPGKTFQAALER